MSVRSVGSAPTVRAVPEESLQSQLSNLGVEQTLSLLRSPDVLEAQRPSARRRNLLQVPLKPAIQDVKDRVANTVVDRLSGKTQRQLGLSLRELLDFDRFFYQALRVHDGAASELLRNVISTEGPLFVYLGEGEPGRYTENEQRIVEAFGQVRRGTYGKPIDQPPEQLPEKYAPVWKRLIQRYQTQQFPVDVVLSGDPSRQSPADLMAVQTVLDAARARNALLDACRGEAFHWDALAPHLEKERPAVAAQVKTLKQLLTPPWLSGNDDHILGWKVPHADATRAYSILSNYRLEVSSLRDDQSRREPVADFVDTVVALHSDALSGTQRYFGKLLRELTPTQRQNLLQAVGSTMFDVGFWPESFRHVPLEKGGYYDREQGIRQVVLHTLSQLGPTERGPFIGVLIRHLRLHQDELGARERRITQLVPAYQPLDPARLFASCSVVERARMLQEEAGPRRAVLDEALSRTDLSPEARTELEQQRKLLSLLDSIGKLTLCNEIVLGPGEALPSRSMAIGEYFGGHQAHQFSPADFAPKAKPPQPVLGRVPQGKKPLAASVVLEGGGGKGFAYPAVLSEVKATLAKAESLGVCIDEYVGTSAGALTAALLAAGYEPEELGALMAELQFPNFYADFVAQLGGLDGKVGSNRTGLFSTRKMYDAMYELISKKVGVSGRPILFRDLPTNLKVVTTVVGSSLSPEAAEELGVGPDGKLVLSADTSPEVDVVAAICASAAVPAFFSSPILQVWSPARDHGAATMQPAHLQLADGGVLNNLPMAEARRTEGEERLMLMLPVYYQEEGASAGDADEVVLSTLDFNPQQVEKVNAVNQRALSGVMGGLEPMLRAAQDEGFSRAVLTFNLATPTQQALPVLQGERRESTERLLGLAKAAKLPVYDADAGAKVVEGNFSKSKLGGKVGQRLFDQLVDQADFPADEVFNTSLFGAPEYRPAFHPLRDVWDVTRAVVAASFVHQTLGDAQLFEKKG